MKAMECTGNDQ